MRIFLEKFKESVMFASKLFVLHFRLLYKREAIILFLNNYPCLHIINTKKCQFQFHFHI